MAMSTTTTTARSEPHSPTFHVNHDTITILAGHATLTVIASVAVALRFWARRLVHLRPGADDWLALATLPVNAALLVVTVFAVGWGDMAGEHGDNDPKTEMLFKCFLSFNFIYYLAAPLTKLTVLALYNRIFPTCFMKRSCMILGILAILHGGAGIVVSGVQCVPLGRFWYMHLNDGHFTGGSCIDILFFYAVMAIPNAIMDGLILALPITEVCKLQTKCGKKIAICAVFMLGICVIAASSTRVSACYTWLSKGIYSEPSNMTGSWAASLVEIPVAILSACLPVLPPVWYRLMPRWDINRSKTSSALSSNRAAADRSLVTIGRLSINRTKRSPWTVSAFSDTGIELERVDFQRLDSVASSIKEPQQSGPMTSNAVNQETSSAVGESSDAAVGQDEQREQATRGQSKEDGV